MMRSAVGVPRPTPASHLTVEHVVALRARLAAQMDAQLDHFGTWARRLAEFDRGPTDEAIALERAIAAVHTYQARELVDDLAAAIDRIDAFTSSWLPDAQVIALSAFVSGCRVTGVDEALSDADVVELGDLVDMLVPPS
jgi:hypothetical protein